MFLCITFVFYAIFSDCTTWISLQTFFKDVEGLLHLVDLQNVCYSSMILSFARCLVE